MGRWQPDARARLQESALALYGERGYEETTVAEIAERAGLTKRTFFRYFADKREVLFGGSAALRELLVGKVAGAAEGTTPIEAVAAAVEATSDMFEDRRAFSRQRSALIASHPELKERELIKLATLAEAIAEALRRRGVGDRAASLAAEAGIAVFKLAFDRWVHDTERTLAQHVRETLSALQAVAAGGGAGSSAPSPRARSRPVRRARR